MGDELTFKLLNKLATGAKTAKELAALLGVSQPTLSRTFAALGNQVATLGRGRATRYARPRPVRGTESVFPVYRIDQAGNVQPLGKLRTLVSGEYWWEPEGPGNGQCLFDHLPWFIQDMRPEGFVGRHFAHQLGAELGLPLKLNDWTDDDTLVALSRRGEDHIGNLVIGDESINRYLTASQAQQPGIPEPECPDQYASLANAAMAGNPAGSSAGGEQPKFSARVVADEGIRHVLVKFSAPTIQPEGRRWADLLYCEHLALEVVQKHGIAAAQSRILEADNRVFLESVRFDRIGSLGRSSTFSLRAIDSEYVGAGDDWVKCAAGLLKAGVVSAEDAESMRWLKVFGELIGNTDMHLGNLSLIRVSANQFALAPIYDMLPMLYRPVSGELPPREFTPKILTMDTASVWASALQAAITFWDMASSEQGLTEEFRGICRNNLAALRKLESGPKFLS